MNLPKLLKSYRGVTKATPRGDFSQAEAARRLKVNLRTYQNWEAGTNTPVGLGLTALLERIK